MLNIMQEDEVGTCQRWAKDVIDKAITRMRRMKYASKTMLGWTREFLKRARGKV